MTNFIDILKGTVYFSEAPDHLLQALAETASMKQLEPGSIIVYEGDPMDNVIVLESGTLLRTKKKDSGGERSGVFDEAMMKTSIAVDKLEGRGRISGLLHSFDSTSRAYATVSAETQASVWLIPSSDIRDLFSEESQCLIKALAKEVRGGSKSLRGLLEKVAATSTVAVEGDKPVLKVLCYDTTSWVSEGFKKAATDFNDSQAPFSIHIDYTADRLTEQSATYAAGYDAICIFVNDTASSKVIQTLSLLGVRMIALRCAGFDRVDTAAATIYGLTVARVPAYSPHSVAEMAVTLLLSLNRKISRASARVKMANFSLDSSLMGFDVFNKTVGVMGTGKIGQILCNIMLGFGTRLLCYDKFESDKVKAAGGTYVPKETIFAEADIIFVMLPLLESTHHIIDEKALSQMKRGVLLVNTSRGGLVDTTALLAAIRSGQVGGVGLDVYENETPYFFQDWGSRHIPDQTLLALIGEPNVVLTAHQAFFTEEATGNIIDTTIQNLVCFNEGLTSVSHPNNCLPVDKK